MSDRILIAEDDHISRRVLEAHLNKWGYDVTVTTNGSEAWECLKGTDAPRLAVLDWMMPDMDGIEICRKVRETSTLDDYTYIILLTAKDQQGDILAGLEAGADDYLTKPFDPRELQIRLRAGARIVNLQQKLIAARETLRMQATHDPLTGLPNRLLFADRLKQVIAYARRRGGHMSVMFVDLDKFKQVNDTLGHEVGDLLLQSVAKRLIENVREADTIARMGGDEFTIILSDLRDVSDIDLVARRVIDVLSQKFVIGGHEINVSGSVGISLFPNDGNDGETLVRNSDMAMYKSKAAGRNNYHRCEASTTIQTGISNQLLAAIEQSELTLHYQTRIDLVSGRISAVEAFVRWLHPEHGLLYPAAFLPAAVETGLVTRLDEWVLETACTHNKGWIEKNLINNVCVAVNVSAASFQRDGFIEKIKNILDKTGLAPELLEIDVAEKALIQDDEHTASTIAELRKLGVKVSIDNFCTGSNSTWCLSNFAVDSVQIDYSVIKGIPLDLKSMEVLESIIPAAHSNRLKVIASGVETTEQLSVLRAINCDEVQGYFLNKPVTVEELGEELESRIRRSIAA